MPPTYAPCLNTLADGWLFNVYIYNAASYGDCVLAQRVCVQIFKKAEAGTVNSGKYLPPEPSQACIFGTHIDSSYNNELASTTIELPSDIISSQRSPCYGDTMLTLPISTIMHTDHSFTDGTVLHLDYPAAESIAGARQTLFGK